MMTVADPRPGATTLRWVVAALLVLGGAALATGPFLPFIATEEGAQRSLLRFVKEFVGEDLGLAVAIVPYAMVGLGAVLVVLGLAYLIRWNAWLQLSAIAAASLSLLFMAIAAGLWGQGIVVILFAGEASGTISIGAGSLLLMGGSAAVLTGALGAAMLPRAGHRPAA